MEGKGCDSNFQLFAELPVPPQMTVVVGHLINVVHVFMVKFLNILFWYSDHHDIMFGP